MKNKFDTLLETFQRHSPNDEYENFVTTHLEAAFESILIKPRAKCWVSWYSIEVREKWDNMKEIQQNLCAEN